MHETVKIWLEKLGNPTAEEIEAEIAEVKGTISNEKLWAYADNIHYDNIALLEEYLEALEDLLEEYEIDRLYHDASEDELRRMGAFDNLNEEKF